MKRTILKPLYVGVSLFICIASLSGCAKQLFSNKSTEEISLELKMLEKELSYQIGIEAIALYKIEGWTLPIFGCKGISKHFTHRALNDEFGRTENVPRADSPLREQLTAVRAEYKEAEERLDIYISSLDEYRDQRKLYADKAITQKTLTTLWDELKGRLYRYDFAFQELAKPRNELLAQANAETLELFIEYYRKANQPFPVSWIPKSSMNLIKESRSVRRLNNRIDQLDKALQRRKY